VRARALFVGALVAGRLAASGPDLCRGLRIVDVSREAAIDVRHDPGAAGEKHMPETMGSGVAWIDYDGDGWLDLYFVQSGPFPPDGSAASANRLLRNRGDGRFEDVTAASASGDRGYGQGVLVVDFDGDGASDLYLANFGRDVLLRNRATGSFEDATSAAGLDVGGWSSSVCAADFDADGWLDLYVARYLEYDPAAPLYCGDPLAGDRRYCDPTMFSGAPDALLRNRSGAGFEDVTRAAGLAEARGRGMGVVCVDLDADERPDVYVANDLDGNFLFRNAGDGRFEDISLVSGAAVSREGKPQAGMGVVAADFVGDGRPHLAVTNFDVEMNALYRNLGSGLFEDESAVSGFGPPSFNLLGFGIVAADFNRDGHLDAFVANGHIFERPFRENVDYAQPDLLLLGVGRGRFVAAACGTAIAARLVGRGLAGGDFDNDGALDLAVANNGGPLQLLHTEGVTGDWLGVGLRGRGGNREAIGARVELTSADRRRSRWVLAGDSYQSSSERRLLFALPEPGPASLEIAWPSGKRQRIVAPATNRYLTVAEPAER